MGITLPELGCEQKLRVWFNFFVTLLAELQRYLLGQLVSVSYSALTKPSSYVNIKTRKSQYKYY